MVSFLTTAGSLKRSNIPASPVPSFWCSWWSPKGICDELSRPDYFVARLHRHLQGSRFICSLAHRRCAPQNTGWSGGKNCGPSPRSKRRLVWAGVCRAVSPPFSAVGFGPERSGARWPRTRNCSAAPELNVERSQMHRPGRRATIAMCATAHSASALRRVRWSDFQFEKVSYGT